MNLTEIWKDISDLQGCYQISSFGRIKLLRSQGILKSFTDNDGYECIKIQLNNDRHHYKIQRIYI